MKTKNRRQFFYYKFNTIEVLLYYYYEKKVYNELETELSISEPLNCLNTHISKI